MFEIMFNLVEFYVVIVEYLRINMFCGVFVLE